MTRDGRIIGWNGTLPPIETTPSQRPRSLSHALIVVLDFFFFLVWAYANGVATDVVRALMWLWCAQVLTCAGSRTLLTWPAKRKAVERVDDAHGASTRILWDRATARLVIVPVVEASVRALVGAGFSHREHTQMRSVKKKKKTRILWSSILATLHLVRPCRLQPARSQSRHATNFFSKRDFYYSLCVIYVLQTFSITVFTLR